MTRQRKWQLKKVKEGKCSICGKANISFANLCLEHYLYKREYQRAFKKYTRRYYGARSYAFKEI